MARKKKAKQRDRQAAPRGVESPASLFVTVGWSLTVLTTLACTAAGGLGEWLLRDRPSTDPAAIFVQLLRVSGAVTAVVSLLLLPVVYRVRREPPPMGLVTFAIVVAFVAILASFR